MPPPLPEATLPEKVLLVMVSSPVLKMAPPKPETAALPENVLLVTASVPLFTTPAPASMKLLPLAIVMFSKVSVAAEFTLNTRTASLPLMVTSSPPSMASVPCPETILGNCEPSTIVPLTLNVMVSSPPLKGPQLVLEPPALLAALIASRKLQKASSVVLSPVVLTTNEAGGGTGA